jgi:hypothetical protein
MVEEVRRGSRDIADLNPFPKPYALAENGHGPAGPVLAASDPERLATVLARRADGQAERGRSGGEGPIAVGLRGTFSDERLGLHKRCTGLSGTAQNCTDLDGFDGRRYPYLPSSEAIKAKLADEKGLT